MSVFSLLVKLLHKPNSQVNTFWNKQGITLNLFTALLSVPVMELYFFTQSPVASSVSSSALYALRVSSKSLRDVCLSALASLSYSLSLRASPGTSLPTPMKTFSDFMAPLSPTFKQPTGHHPLCAAKHLIYKNVNLNYPS